MQSVCPRLGLDPHQITDAAVQLRLTEAERRPLLLCGLSPGLIATLPRFTRPVDQLRADLWALLYVATLQGDATPVAVWLRNAVAMTRGVPCPAAERLRDALRRVEASIMSLDRGGVSDESSGGV